MFFDNLLCTYIGRFLRNFEEIFQEVKVGSKMGGGGCDPLDPPPKSASALREVAIVVYTRSQFLAAVLLLEPGDFICGWFSGHSPYLGSVLHLCAAITGCLWC